MRARGVLRRRGASSSVECHGFRDGYFPYVGGEVKDVFEELKSTVEPDLIFTHARHDLHQDHRLVCELTWNTWRDHLVLEYEIPKYDGDLGAPERVRPASTRTTPGARSSCSSDTSRASATSTGSTTRSSSVSCACAGSKARSPSGYAEAFFARKLVLGRRVT